MKTSDGLASILTDWEKSKGVKRGCINCGCLAWSSENYYGFHKIPCAEPDVAFPVVILRCENCSYIKMYSAVAVGVVKGLGREKNENQ